MSEQAAVLERLVGRFKLDEATQQPSYAQARAPAARRAADAQLTWRRSSRLHAGDVTRARVALPAQQIEKRACGLRPRCCCTVIQGWGAPARRW
jgi:1,6-anhydro-N-acetylmuramate kinase